MAGLTPRPDILTTAHPSPVRICPKHGPVRPYPNPRTKDRCPKCLKWLEPLKPRPVDVPPNDALVLRRGQHVRLHLQWEEDVTVIDGHVVQASSEWVILGCGIPVPTGLVKWVENLDVLREGCEMQSADRDVP